MKELKYLFPLIVSFSCAKPNYVSQPKLKSENLTTDCEYHFTTEDLCLKTKWVTMPTESQFGEMSLTFSDFNDLRILRSPREKIEIVLWMPSMGHGSSPVTVEEISEGRFSAKNVFFIMHGPWDIRYQIKDGNNVVEEVIQKITI